MRTPRTKKRNFSDMTMRRGNEPDRHEKRSTIGNSSRAAAPTQCHDLQRHLERIKIFDLESS